MTTPEPRGKMLPDGEGHWTRFYDNEPTSGAPAFHSIIVRCGVGHTLKDGLLFAGWEGMGRSEPKPQKPSGTSTAKDSATPSSFYGATDSRSSQPPRQTLNGSCASWALIGTASR
jgi:hypothetical protein